MIGSNDKISINTYNWINGKTISEYKSKNRFNVFCALQINKNLIVSIFENKLKVWKNNCKNCIKTVKFNEELFFLENLNSELFAGAG